jgi:cation:H+ antiporter
MDEVIQLLAATALLTVASYAIAVSGEKLSERLGHSFGAGVLLGLMTALPETILVYESLALGQVGAGLSSAVGANAMLMTLGLGLLGLVFFLKYRSPITLEGKYGLELRALLISTALIGLSLLASALIPGTPGEDPLERAILALTGGALASVYVIYAFKSFSTSNEEEKGEGGVTRHIFLLIAGGLLAIAVTPYFLKSVEEVSQRFGVPFEFLVYLVSPVAAELEEMLSAYIMIFRGKELGSPAVYSFLGSKIENSTLLISPFLILGTDLTSYSPLLVALIISNLFSIAVLKDGRLGLKESLIGLALYVSITFALYSLGVAPSH